MLIALERCDPHASGSRLHQLPAEACRSCWEPWRTPLATRNAQLQRTKFANNCDDDCAISRIDPAAAAMQPMDSDDQTVHTVPPITVHTPDEPELSVALIGCGWYALRTHCVTLSKAKTTIAAVCARTEASRQKALAKLGTSAKEFADVAFAINAASCALVALPAAVAGRACLTANPTRQGFDK